MNQHRMFSKPALTTEQASWLDVTMARNRAIFGGFLMEEPVEKTPEEKAADDAAAAKKKPDDDASKVTREAGIPDNYAVDPQGKSLGYPKDTPVVEMKPEEQTAYHRTHSRKHEQRANAWQSAVGDRTPDQVKADLAELDEVRRAKMSDSERAVEDAKKAGRSEGLSAANEKTARFVFDVALDHVDEDRRKVIVESLDLAKFVGTDGVIDTDMVKTVAAKLAPKSDKDTRAPDYGGGRRSSAASSGVSAGRSRYQERHGKKASTD